MSVEILYQKGYDFLWIDSELVMWDLPEEMECQLELASQANGFVLVAGYGLGIIQKYLLANDNVLGKYLLTVEKNEEVINVCAKRYGQIYGKVVTGDFLKYNTDSKFDCVIGDVWSDILPKGLKQYKKFKKKAQKLIVPEGRILAWGQDYYEYLINKKSK